MKNVVSNRDLKENLKKLVDKKQNVYGKICTIVEVDLQTFTCKCRPIDSTPDYTNVKLSLSDTSSNVKIPAVGTRVVIQFLDNQTAYVSMIDNVEKYITRTHNDNAEELADLKTTLLEFADGIKDVFDTFQVNSPQGPTSPGLLPPVNQQLNNYIDTFKENLNNLFE